MRARVDMAKAAASIIMRRKLKGGAAAMSTLASQALLQAGSGTAPPVDPMAMGQAPRPGSVVEENDYVQHEAFNLNSGSAGAMQDAQLIRSQPCLWARRRSSAIPARPSTHRGPFDLKSANDALTD